MFIEKIKLNNYRQYKGENVIDLGIEGDKNINVIIGSNGAGKTNLSNAIQWCFYGTEDIEEDIDFGILNMEVFENLNKKDNSKVEVEVQIKTEEGERYSLIREKKIKKEDNKQETVPYKDEGKDGSKFRAYFHKTKKFKKPSQDTDYPSRLVDKIAPQKIKNYFFFDGEVLENYFQASSSKKIRESIFNISNLDLLDSIEGRLEKILDEYRKESRRINPENEELVKEIEDLNQYINEIKEKKESKEETLEKLKLEKKKLFNEFKKLGGKDVKEVLERIETLEKEKKNTSNKLSSKSEEKNSRLIGNSYLFFGYSALEDSLDIFQKAREEKKIPPDISKSFINELLKNNKCICGLDLSKNKNKEHEKKLKELLNKVSGLGDNAGELVKKEGDISNIKSYSFKNINSEVKLLNEQIVELEESLSRIEKEIEDKKAKVGDTSLEEVDNFEDKINQLDENIGKYTGDISKLESQLEDKQEEKSEKNKELKKQNKKIEEGKRLNKYIDFTEKSKEFATEIKNKIMDEIREEISDETERYYQELHWKKKENIDIKIDEDYKISALQDDYNKFGAFSAGEEALLAMSFIFALNNVSGFKVPIILDTALGRISPGPKENYSKNISNYLKNTQVILLFTGSEYSPEVKDKLSDSIYVEHEIKLDTPMSAKIK